jgi:hypothetical protein
VSEHCTAGWAATRRAPARAAALACRRRRESFLGSDAHAAGSWRPRRAGPVRPPRRLYALDRIRRVWRDYDAWHSTGPQVWSRARHCHLGLPVPGQTQSDRVR